ncbi:hypothetical protein E2P81_ATG10418 [Venturia nashicola]|nr:hypothetical protein E2P81_ATG10418 [Venturia nashicola]
MPSATITTTATPGSTSSPVDAPSQTPKTMASLPGSLSTAAYVGVAIAITLSIVLFCAVVYFLRKRRQSDQKTHGPMPSMALTHDSPEPSYEKSRANIMDTWPELLHQASWQRNIRYQNSAQRHYSSLRASMGERDLLVKPRSTLASYIHMDTC